MDSKSRAKMALYGGILAGVALLVVCGGCAPRLSASPSEQVVSSDFASCEVGELPSGAAFMHDGQPYVRVWPGGDRETALVLPLSGPNRAARTMGVRTWVRKCDIRVVRGREPWE